MKERHFVILDLVTPIVDEREENKVYAFYCS